MIRDEPIGEMKRREKHGPVDDCTPHLKVDRVFDQMTFVVEGAKNAIKAISCESNTGEISMNREKKSVISCLHRLNENLL